jgi:uncharacterized lipoprotein YmbA
MSLCAALIALLSTGCASDPPPVSYYKMAVGMEVNERAGGGVLGVEMLSADTTYDDARMVYRTSDYRVDYYYYHRWSAPPAVMVTDAMRQLLWGSGRFERVVNGAAGADAVLMGRLVALEEVDSSDAKWVARLVLELKLVRGDELLWSRLAREEVALERQHPEGLAQALSEALVKIVAAIGPELEEAMRGKDMGK